MCLCVGVQWKCLEFPLGTDFSSLFLKARDGNQQLVINGSLVLINKPINCVPFNMYYEHLVQ